MNSRKEDTVWFIGWPLVNSLPSVVVTQQVVSPSDVFMPTSRPLTPATSTGVPARSVATDETPGGTGSPFRLPVQFSTLSQPQTMPTTVAVQIIPLPHDVTQISPAASQSQTTLSALHPRNHRPPPLRMPDRNSPRIGLMKTDVIPSSLSGSPARTSLTAAPSAGGGLTPADVTARINQLINKNQAIVNTPMAEGPRHKRVFKQKSEAAGGHSSGHMSSDGTGRSGTSRADLLLGGGAHKLNRAKSMDASLLRKHASSSNVMGPVIIVNNTGTCTRI